MPIRKVKGGYKWGGHGHVYKNRKGAERQAAAAHANGFKGESFIDLTIVQDADGLKKLIETQLAKRAEAAIDEFKKTVAEGLLSEVSAGAMSRAKEHREAQQAAYHKHMHEKHWHAAKTGEPKEAKFHIDSAAAHSREYTKLTGRPVDESVEQINEVSSGDRVRIHYPEHMRRGLGAVFHGKTGTIQGHEMDGRTKMHRVRLDEPAHVEGIGHVHDDLWQGSYLKKLREDEQLDELNKSTLASYIPKATTDFGRHKHYAGMNYQPENKPKDPTTTRERAYGQNMSQRRFKGILRATTSLAKK